MIGSICCRINDTHISTRVVVTRSVTSTIYIIYNVGTLDGNFRCRYGSSITTTINVVDAGLFTTFNNHFRAGCI